LKGKREKYGDMRRDEQDSGGANWQWPPIRHNDRLSPKWTEWARSSFDCTAAHINHHFNFVSLNGGNVSMYRKTISPPLSASYKEIAALISARTYTANPPKCVSDSQESLILKANMLAKNERE